MKINYFFIVKINTLGKFYERYRECIIQDVQYCCEEMEQAYDNVIRFGLLEMWAEPRLHLYAKDNEWYRDNTPISYCPFCGEKFESECTKTLTKTAVKKQITETKEVIEYVLD